MDIAIEISEKQRRRQRARLNARASKSFLRPRKGGGGGGGSHGGGGHEGGGGSHSGGDDGGGGSHGGGGDDNPGGGGGGGDGSPGGGGGPGGGGSGGGAGDGSPSGGGADGSPEHNSKGQPESTTGGTTSHGRFALPSNGNSTKRGATPFSEGGGSIITVPAGSVFAGRELGGGTRDEVFGGFRYGSGYPYGERGSYLGGRPFPFGFWPIYWGPRYYGGDEYGPETNSSRPGGSMSTVRVQAAYWQNVTNPVANTSEPTMYPFNIIGDAATVQAVFDVLVTSSCSVSNLTIVPYSTTNTSQPGPENVVQYYRASSFGLALDGYNNTAESLANMPPNNATYQPPNITDTPLPTNYTDFDFLACINTTIGQTVPIMDSAASPVAFLMQASLGTIVGLAWFLVFAFNGLLR